MQFWFIRHGESGLNAEGRFAGAIDTPLTELGWTQGQRAAQQLIEHRIDWLVCSPMRRAVDTAWEIANEFGLDVDHDPRLVEHRKGELEGEPRRPMTSADWDATPGAEPVAEFHARVTAALVDLAERRGIGVVVAHAGVARVIDTLLAGDPPSSVFDRPGAPNGEPRLVRMVFPR